MRYLHGTGPRWCNLLPNSSALGAEEYAVTPTMAG
jgi:hypothetical protein